jgi:hypothetical protein
MWPPLHLADEMMDSFEQLATSALGLPAEAAAPPQTAAPSHTTAIEVHSTGS